MTPASEMRVRVLAGGCQCGAVRYALYTQPSDPHLCHCRMCQKAFGGPFAPLAVVAMSDFTWTRGSPAWFRSSEAAERGFCHDCGTPLHMRDVDSDRIYVALGSLDRPDAVVPGRQCGVEAKHAWTDRIAGLPGSTTEASTPPATMARYRSRQHPDHDTDAWPPPG